MFWQHHDLLLSCDRESLLTTIEQITQRSLSGYGTAAGYPIPIAATQNAIALGKLTDQVPTTCTIIHIHSYEESDEHDLSLDSERALRLRIRHDKNGEREFVQVNLPAVDAFCAKQFTEQRSELQLAVLHSSSTVDVAIGITIMVLARYFGVEGEPLGDGGTMSKPNAAIPQPFALMVEQYSRKSRFVAV
jgi:hypothetical protein